MQSYAERPSMETMVASASSSVATRSNEARLSVPDRAWRANWKGRVARSKVSACERAMARDVRRRNTSPVAMPRTPPAGFWRAVRRERASTPRMGGGTLALASAVMA